MTKNQLRKLARKAVATKIAYWDAVLAFEESTASNSADDSPYWDDGVETKVNEEIEAIAVGELAQVTDDMLDALVAIAQQ